MARSAVAPIVLAAGFACAVMVGVVVSQTAPSLGSRVASRVASRTACMAQGNRDMPVPWGQSAGKPRAAKPAYTKSVSKAPLRTRQPWVGEWVDPVAMFSGKLDFGRSGKKKVAVNYNSGKPATPVKKLVKKSWTGNLGSYYEKLVAKGQPYVAPSMEKAESTSSMKYPTPWIGQAVTQLLQGTADAMEYVENPTPKKKMWMTVNDPNGPWKKAKQAALPEKAETSGTPVSEVIAEKAPAAAPAAAAEKVEKKEAVAAA